MKNVSLIFGFLLTLPGFAQVMNGGFEQCTSYPSDLGQIDLLAGWSNAGSQTSSPDFYHYAGNMAGDIPITPAAEVDAHGGSGVAGFSAISKLDANQREYLCNHLLSPLNPGETYRVSFQLTNGFWTAGSMAGLETSDLGVYLSELPPVQNGTEALLVTPQAKLDTTFYSRTWKEVVFEFEATAAYRYLTIGVFGNGPTIEVTDVDGVDPQVAYYFVDDVDLISLSSPEQNLNVGDIDRQEDQAQDIPDDSAKPSFYIPNAFSPNYDGDNDVFKPVLPEVREYRMQIYSRWGEVVYETVEPSNGWNGRTPKDQEAMPGMYIWQIEYLEQQGEEWVPAERQGTLYLMR